jgi:hypothetical protein
MGDKPVDDRPGSLPHTGTTACQASADPRITLSSIRYVYGEFVLRLLSACVRHTLRPRPRCTSCAESATSFAPVSHAGLRLDVLSQRPQTDE